MTSGQTRVMGPAILALYDGTTFKKVFTGKQRSDSDPSFDKFWGIEWRPVSSNPRIGWVVGEAPGKLYQFNYFPDRVDDPATEEDERVRVINKNWPDGMSDLFSVAWKPDGSYALLSGDGPVLHKGDLLSNYTPIVSPNPRNYVAVGWKPDGSYSVCGGAAGILDRLDGAGGVPTVVIDDGDIAPPPGGAGHVWQYQDVAWQPTGNYAIVTGGDHGGGPHGLAVVYDGSNWYEVLPWIRSGVGPCSWRPGQNVATAVAPFDFGK